MGIVTPSEDQNAVDMGGLASLSGRDYDSGVAHQPYNGPLNPNPEPGAAPEIDTGYPQGSFAHKLAQSLSATANHPAAPTLLKQPGGFAKMILGASLDALQGNLGDAAAATAPVAPGAGWLSGVLRTEAAGAQRQAAEKQQQFQNNIEQQKAADEHQRNQALIAHENIATRHDQYLVSKLGAEQQEESVKTGKLNMQPFVTGLAPAQIIKEGVTSDDVQALIAQNHLDPTQQHAFPTGLAPVEGKFDESGRQIMRPTYTIIGDVPNVTVDKTNAAFISQFTHHDFKEGQVLPGAQYGYLVQQAASAQTAIASINQARQKNDLEKLSGDLKAQELMMLPDWNEALSKSRNDPFLALRYLQTDSAMAKKYPNAATNVMGLYGGPKEWETMRKDRADEARKLQEDRDKEADKHAAALQDLNVAMTDEMKQRIGALPADKRAVLESAPKSVQAALLSAAFGPGDLDFDRVFPTRLTKGAPGISAQNAISIIKQVNPNWDEQQYKLTSKAYKDVTSGASGRDIGMYNNVLAHAEEASDVMMEGYRKAPKLWNIAVNKLEQEFGGEQASRIKSALLPVKEEYALLMSSGYKPGEEEMKAYNTLINDAATPGQINAALKVMAAVGAVRLNNINQQYKRVAGKNIPGILTRDSMGAAKRLGLDELTMARLNSLNVGDTLFHNENYKPPTAEEVQAQEQQKQATIDAARAARQAAAPAGATAHSTSADGKTTIYLVNGQWVTAQGQKVQ